jgi:chorismate synthase
MPINFTVGIKPTPSIGKPQKTVNIKTGQNDILEIKGRHDPCIVPRAVPCIEAAAAIAIAQLLL